MVAYFMSFFVLFHLHQILFIVDNVYIINCSFSWGAHFNQDIRFQPFLLVLLLVIVYFSEIVLIFIHSSLSQT